MSSTVIQTVHIIHYLMLITIIYAMEEHFSNPTGGKAAT